MQILSPTPKVKLPKNDIKEMTFSPSLPIKEAKSNQNLKDKGRKIELPDQIKINGFKRMRKEVYPPTTSLSKNMSLYPPLPPNGQNGRKRGAR